MDAATERSQRYTRAITWITMLFVIAPFVVSALQTTFTIGNRYHPPGDFASIEMQIRDVGHHPVLVGLYSRSDWHHPGPAFFYLLALPYRLLGSTSSAVDVGALMINGAAIVVTGLLARRRGGIALMMCTLVGLSVATHSLGPDFLRSPWNPSLTVIPYAAMIFITWSMVCGDWWALPAGMFTASFLIQTHVGYLVLAAPLLALGTVVLIVLARGSEQRRLNVTWGVVLALAIGLVMWTPPLIDQFTHHPANLGKIAHYFLHPDGPTHQFRESWRVVTGEFGKRPEWVTGGLPLITFLNGAPKFVLTAPTPVLLVPFLLAIVVLARRRDRTGLWLAGIVALSLVLGVYAAMRTVGLLLAYRLRWTWIIAALAMVIVLWVVWTVIAARWRSTSAAFVAVSLIAVAGLNFATSVDAARAGYPIPAFTPQMNSIVKQTFAAVPKGRGVVLVRNPQLDPIWVPGLILAFEHRGDTVKVDRDPVSLMGDHRVYRSGPVRVSVAVQNGLDAVIAPQGTRMIAFEADCSRQRLLEERFVRNQLDNEHASHQLTDQEYFERLQKLCNPASAVSVVMDQG